MVELGTLIHQAKIVRCEEGNYPVLSMTMHDGLVFQNDKFNKIIASKDRSDYKVVNRNQLVISFPIDEGVLAAQRIVDAGIVSPAYGIWDINQELILPEFLEYALRCDRALSYYKAKLRGSTARRRSLPTPTLLAYTVPLPDISEQEHILNVVHKTQKVISGRTEEISLLDNLIKARFVELFGNPISNPMKWDIYQLEECLERIDNGKSFICSDKPRDGDNPAILKLSAATYGDYRPNENKALLDESLFVESSEVHAGDLLFTRKNTPELVGTATYVQNTPPKLMMPDLIFRLVPNEKVNAVFLWQLINCKEFRPVIQAISGGSAKSMSNISKERLGKIKVICPPRELQDSLIPFVKRVDKSKVVEAIYKTNTLFNIILNGGNRYDIRANEF